MLVNVCTLAAGRRLVQQPVGSVQPSVPVSVYEDPILVAATLAQQSENPASLCEDGFVLSIRSPRNRR